MLQPGLRSQGSKDGEEELKSSKSRGYSSSRKLPRDVQTERREDGRIRELLGEALNGFLTPGIL